MSDGMFNPLICLIKESNRQIKKRTYANGSQRNSTFLDLREKDGFSISVMSSQQNRISLALSFPLCCQPKRDAVALPTVRP